MKAYAASSLIRVAEPRQGITLEFVSAAGGSRLPFTAGMAFKKGDMSAGVVTDIASQWTTKNRWNDGSVKIGQISGFIDLQPGVPKVVRLANGTTSGTALTLEQLKAAKLKARIAVAGHGEVQWSGADWDTPHEQWIAGAHMSSWLYFKRLDKTWLTGWIEVRLYANGQTAVLASLENGYVRMPGRALRQGQVTFALNDEIRYDSVRTAWIYDHGRYILAENADGWHWTGANPNVFVKLDTHYLMTTGLVPHYPFASPDVRVLQAYQQHIVPFTFVDQKRRPEGSPAEERHGTANLPNPWRRRREGWKLQGGVGAGGYHDSIGVLPRWDAMYLTSGGAAPAYNAMLANHAACGLGWFHMRRDAGNGELHRWSDTPRMSYGTTADDRYATASDEHYEAYYNWKASHMPQVGFLPYLATGAKYWCDETIMLGVYVGQALTVRGRAGTAQSPSTDAEGLRMIVWEESALQPRGAAWAHRAIACAACATPDGHPNKQPFVDSMAHTARFILDASVKGTTLLGPTFANKLGILPQNHYLGTPYGEESLDTYVAPAWMYAFWIAAIGYGWDLVEDHFDAQQRADYLAARDFAYRWSVGLAGQPPGGWCWRAAGTASIGVTRHLHLPSPQHGETSFFDSFGEMWEENVKRRVANNVGKAAPNYQKYGKLDCSPGGTLFTYAYLERVEATLYWGNYLPSLAYAVMHDAPGAREGWARILTARNIDKIMSNSSTYRNNPVWGIRPR